MSLQYKNKLLAVFRIQPDHPARWAGPFALVESKTQNIKYLYSDKKTGIPSRIPVFDS
jgi:hypothetical protein